MSSKTPLASLGAVLALALVLAAAPPPTEGWWPLSGLDPHPVDFPAPAARRAAAAVVDLGDERSGVFVGREGLILTSATALEGCTGASELGTAPETFRFPAQAPACEGWLPAVRIDVRDVTEAIAASRAAGAEDPGGALVSSCESVGPGRRCALRRRGPRRLLEVQQVFGTPRVRFWPGRARPAQGGPSEAPLDVALLSVETGPGGPPAWLRAGRGPDPDAPVWLLHHPGPSLRGTSVVEHALFFEHVLPAWRARADDDRDVRAVEGWARLGGALMRRARHRELSTFARIRGFPKERRLRWARAFTKGRDARAESAPTDLAALRRGPEQAGLGRAYAGAEAVRRDAFRVAGVAPLGPDGDGSLRVSRGWVAHPPEAARPGRRRAPRPPDRLRVAADVAPRATGGPVVDAEGRVVGVLSGGGEATLRGLARFDPGAEVVVVRLSAAARWIRALGAPELARALGR